MKKALLCLSIPLLVLSLTACGQKGGTTSQSSEPTSEVLCDISLNEAHVELKLDETFQIEALYKGAASSFTFESRNSAIATVSATGLVTAIAEGETAIKVSNDKDFTYLRVTVVDAGAVKVDGLLDLVLEENEVNVLIGNEYKLNPVLKNEGKVITNATFTYSSSNISIAEVINGSIKGKNAGEAVITVTGSYQGATVTETVKVTVISVSNFPVVDMALRELDAGSSLVLNYELKGYKDGELKTLADASKFTYTVDSTNAKVITEGSNQKLLGLRKGYVKVTGTINYEGNVYSVSEEFRVREIYTVNYYVGAVLFGSETLRDGELLQLTSKPTSPNKEFYGWANGSEVIDMNEGVKSSMDLTAKWLVNSTNLNADIKKLVLDYTVGDEVDIIGGSRFLWKDPGFPGYPMQLNVRGAAAETGKELVGVYYTIKLPAFPYGSFGCVSFNIGAGWASAMIYGVALDFGNGAYQSPYLKPYDDKTDPTSHQVAIKEGQIYYDGVATGVSPSSEVMEGSAKFEFRVFTKFVNKSGTTYNYAGGYLMMTGLYSHLEIE